MIIDHYVRQTVILLLLRKFYFSSIIFWICLFIAERESDEFYEVLFDEEFPGGLTIRFVLSPNLLKPLLKSIKATFVFSLVGIVTRISPFMKSECKINCVAWKDYLAWVCIFLWTLGSASINTFTSQEY